MTQVDPSILSALGQYDQSMDQVEADNGFGSRGIWPPEDELIVLVRGVTLRTGKFYNSKTDRKSTTPSIVIQFLYRTMPDHPTMPNHDFGGVEFNLPTSPNSAGDNAWRVDSDQKRLKGHLQVCLGDQYASGPGAQQANLQNLLNRAQSPFAVKVKLERRPKGEGKTGTYDTDFLISAE